MPQLERCIQAVNGIRLYPSNCTYKQGEHWYSKNNLAATYAQPIHLTNDSLSCIKGAMQQGAMQQARANRMHTAFC